MKNIQREDGVLERLYARGGGCVSGKDGWPYGGDWRTLVEVQEGRSAEQKQEVRAREPKTLVVKILPLTRKKMCQGVRSGRLTKAQQP